MRPAGDGHGGRVGKDVLIARRPQGQHDQAALRRPERERHVKGRTVDADTARIKGLRGGRVVIGLDKNTSSAKPCALPGMVTV